MLLIMVCKESSRQWNYLASMKYFLIAISLSLLCCKADTHIPGSAYLPANWEDGLAYKYYLTITKKDNPDHPKTNIIYRTAVPNPQGIQETVYNAAFQAIGQRQLRFTDNEWLLSEEKINRFYGDSPQLDTSYISSIEANTWLNWGGPGDLLRKRHRDTWQSALYKVQASPQDTVVDGRAGKSFNFDLENTFIQDQDTTTYTFDVHAIYLEGLGLAREIEEHPSQSNDLVLDQIISIEEFNRRAKHGMHRVAYIDTTQVLDDAQAFEPCGHTAEIYDYYNCDRAQVLGGKGRLWDMLDEQLDPALIAGKSGLLTYRFVINCEGQAGWFITRTSTLDYQAHDFGMKVEGHFYNMLRAEQNWKALQCKGSAKDAYAYITFVLNDGHVVEILP